MTAIVLKSPRSVDRPVRGLILGPAAFENPVDERVDGLGSATTVLKQQADRMPLSQWLAQEPFANDDRRPEMYLG